MRLFVLPTMWFGLFLQSSEQVPQRVFGQSQEQKAKAKLMDTQQQILDLKKKIESLQQEEKALLKELEQRAAEKREQKGHYVKVEAKGVLRKHNKPDYRPRLGKQRPVEPDWIIQCGGDNGSTFGVAFGGDKELIELAEKFEGRTVLLTGRVTSHAHWPAPAVYGLTIPVISATTLKDAQ